MAMSYRCPTNVILVLCIGALLGWDAQASSLESVSPECEDSVCASDDTVLLQTSLHAGGSLIGAAASGKKAEMTEKMDHNRTAAVEHIDIGAAASSKRAEKTEKMDHNKTADLEYIDINAASSKRAEMTEKMDHNKTADLEHIDVNQKVYRNGVSIFGGAEGYLAENKCVECRGNCGEGTKFQVCGTRIKMSFFQGDRGDCRDAPQNIKVLGKCNVGMPPDTCETLTVPSLYVTRGRAYKNYKIEKCPDPWR